MKASEIIYGGVWAASAVAVAGYTWNAYTGEYGKFPTMGGSGESIPSPLHKLPLNNFGYYWLENARKNVGHWISNAFGGPTTPAQKRVMSGTHHADPSNYAK